MLHKYFLIFLLSFLTYGGCQDSKVNIIHRAKIESCAGCKLNQFPELKAFIYQDFTTYDNTEVSFIPGASPELIFLNKLDEEIERIDLTTYGRAECNELLQKNGFQLKENLKNEL